MKLLTSPKRLFLRIGVLLLLVLPSNVQSQYLSYTPLTDSLVACGIAQIHNLQLDSSAATFEQLIQYYPQHPMGFFYKAGIYDLFNQNYRITTYEKEYKAAIDRAIDMGEKYTGKNKNDALGFFYLGGAYGFRGLHRVRERDWVNAFIDGFKGLAYLQKSLVKRPDLYDAYFGLGLYHYWRSALTGVLRILPLVPDQRRQGIHEIRLAIEKGRYVRIEGQFALETIFYNKAEYDSALVINDWLFQCFPQDPSALYMRARIFLKKQDWQNLLTATEALNTTLLAYPYKSIGYQIECQYLLAVAHYQLNQQELARHDLEKALALRKMRNKKTELEGPLEDFDEIFNEVKKLSKKINTEK